MPEGVREVKSFQPRFPCPAFGGIEITFDGCQQITTVRERNEKHCSELGCACSWRICKVCVREGAVGATSYVADSRSGVCLKHGGTSPEEPEITFDPPKTEKEELADTEPAHPPEICFDYRRVAAQHIAAKASGESGPSLFELVDAVTAMRSEGRSHAKINGEFGYAANNQWSSRLYPLRYLTPETRRAMVQLQEIPSLALLTQVAYTKPENQIMQLDTLLHERATIVERRRKKLAQRTVLFLTKTRKHTQELHRRIKTSGMDIQDPTSVITGLEQTIDELLQCKEAMRSYLKL